MKRISTYYRTQRIAIAGNILIALAFVIPLYDKLVVYIISLMLLNWLLDGNWKRRYQLVASDTHRQHLLAFTSLYFIYCIGLLYTSNLSYALFDLVGKLSLLIFPLVFATMEEEVITSKRLYRIFYAYLSGCVGITLLVLFWAVMNFSRTNSSEVFYYKYLSAFQHPSYLSMNLDFAVAGIIFILLNKARDLHANVRNILIILIVYFFAIIIMLSSKAGIISLMMVLTVSISSIVIYRKDFVIGVLFLFILPFSFIGAYYVFPNSFMRMNKTTAVVTGAAAYDSTTSEGTGERLLIWGSSLELVKENPVFGVGTGDVKDVLMKKYKEKGITNALLQRLNAHNQYLQTTIALGFFGLLVLLLSLYLPMHIAVRQKNLLVFLFILIIAFNLLVESMFERQAGIVFYSFFNGLLFYWMRVMKADDTNSFISG